MPVPAHPGARVRLNNNAGLPILGLGVWQIPNGAPTAEAVRWALAAGYRHIDTAKVYGNEEGVGEGIRTAGIPRAEIWVTTKLWPTNQFHAQRAFDESLARLGTGYIDLYLVHWPTPGLITRTWKAMERVYESGLCKAIGVSNHSIAQLSAILRAANVPPAVNQVKWSPFGFDQALLDFCRDHAIVVEAYSPLTKGQRLHDERLRAVAERYGKSPAQILIRWALQKGTVVLPKSQRREHIAENAAVFDFSITDGDMAQLDALSAPSAPRTL
jgi:diketogulonate reductase-like aldo/keto reductase